LLEPIERSFEPGHSPNRAAPAATGSRAATEEKAMAHPFRKAVLAMVCAAVLAPGALSAQVTFAGDARFRPRLDLDDRTEDPAAGFSMTRFYYQYRIRLDMTAAIGEGYYAKTRLGHNGIAFYARGGTGDPPEVLGTPVNTISEPMANRPSVDFMYVYMGRATPTFGFDLGLIPIPGFNNPLWDLHYYPGQMIDVPYFIWNTDGGFGGHMYANVGPGRLTMYTLLDRAVGERRESAEGTVIRDHDDQYTLVASYAVNVGGGVNVMPMVLKSFNATLDERPGGVQDPARSGGYNAPLTVGAQLTLPKVGPLTPTAFGGFTRSSVASSLDVPRPAYDGWLARLRVTGKVGPGHVLVWGDVAQRTDKAAAAGASDVTTNFLHAWLNYRIPVYESDRGNFSIGPEWRIINVGRDDLTLRRRHKIEANFDLTFR
jgi:hypothetical protein